jgi:hypothetical protein
VPRILSFFNPFPDYPVLKEVTFRLKVIAFRLKEVTFRLKVITFMLKVTFFGTPSTRIETD